MDLDDRSETGRIFVDLPRRASSVCTVVVGEDGLVSTRGFTCSDPRHYR